jgi:hypothetical protein
MIIRKKRKKKRRAHVKRRRINPSVYFITGGLVLVLGLILLLILYHGGEEVTKRSADIFRLENKNAVVIRDEYVYLSTAYSHVDCIAEEGKDVSEGDKLAVVYKRGYSDALMQSLLNAREEVYKAQMERIGSTKDTKLEEMNASAAAITARIEACVMRGSGEDLGKLYRELDAVLKERTEHLRGKVQETETLRALYADADAKEELISAWTEEVYAENEGAVSFYFDGYEQAMNVEKLNMLTAALVDRAIKESGSSHWTTDDNTRVCRVVNRNKWYLAFTTGEEELSRTAAGIEYEIAISGVGVFRGVALEPFLSGKEFVNLIEFDTDIGDLMEIRSVKATITAAVTGIEVKSTAITFEDGKPYVELMIDDSHLRIWVDVLSVGKETVIVKPHNSTDVLGEGVRYWNRKKR